MPKDNGLYIDSTKFDAEFKKIVEQAIPGLAKKGLFLAMNELLNDAVKLPPQAPKDIGDLWASKSNTVSVNYQGSQIYAQGGFNIVYATRWHEAEPNIHWTRNKGASQPGPKFLESKMISYKDRYIKIVAWTINQGAK